MIFFNFGALKFSKSFRLVLFTERRKDSPPLLPFINVVSFFLISYFDFYSCLFIFSTSFLLNCVREKFQVFRNNTMVDCSRLIFRESDCFKMILPGKNRFLHKSLTQKGEGYQFCFSAAQKSLLKFQFFCILTAIKYSDLSFRILKSFKLF